MLEFDACSQLKHSFFLSEIAMGSHFSINLELRDVYFVYNANIRLFGISSAFKGVRAHSVPPGGWSSSRLPNRRSSHRAEVRAPEWLCPRLSVNMPVRFWCPFDVHVCTGIWCTRTRPGQSYRRPVRWERYAVRAHSWSCLIGRWFPW